MLRKLIHITLLSMVLILPASRLSAQGKIDRATGIFFSGQEPLADEDREMIVRSSMLRAPFVPDYGERPSACPEVQIPAQDMGPNLLRRIDADCPGRPVSIQPVFSVSGGQPTTYSVEAIPYNPPIPDDVSLSTITEDDKWATVQTLPFGFCFYEHTYNQVAICANGILSFNAAMVSGRDAGWRTDDLPPIPSPLFDKRNGSSGYTDVSTTGGGYNWLNAIYGVFEDVDPSRGGTISYGVIGQAPCRMLVVKWDMVPLYNRDRIARLFETFSIVLYEGSNVIDVYVGRRNYDSGWNSGYGIIGVQNSTGTVGTAAPGRNNGDIWSTMNGVVNTPEAWRFIPQTTSQAQYTMRWYRGQGTNGEYLGSGDSYTFTPRLNVGMRDTVTVHLSITACNGDIYQLQDTAEIVWPDIEELVAQRDVAYICQGESYNYRGSTYTEEGVYYAHGPTDECDDPSVLYLHVNPTYNITFTETICQGDVYSWLGEEFDQPGFYTRHLQTVNQCDSTVTLNLIVNPSYNHEFTKKICDNETFRWQGETYNQTCNVTKNLTTRHGCDSIVTMHLIVNPTYNTEFFDTICADLQLPANPSGEDGMIYSQEGTYTWERTTYKHSGDYTKTLRTVDGCDSVVTLHLTVNPAYYYTFSETICQGEKYEWQGELFDRTGRYTKRLMTKNKCDSTVTLNLTVNPTYNHEFTKKICDNETFRWQGDTYNQTCNVTKNLTTRHGCDSIVTMHLIVNPTYNTEFFDTICADLQLPANPSGEDGMIYSQEGTYTWERTTYKHSGDYTKTLRTVDGCDSVVTLHLTVNPAYYYTFSEAICQGEKYEWQGELFDRTGRYTKRLMTKNKCDSTVTLNLTVNPTYNHEFTKKICDNETFQWQGDTYNQTCNVTKNLTTRHGCDSIVTMHLIVNPTYNTEFFDTICDNQIYRWQGSSYTTPGDYTKTLNTVNGCDSIVTLHLTVNPTYRIFENDTINFDETYTWRGHTYSESGSYNDSFLSRLGCDSIVTLKLYKYQTLEMEYLAPDFCADNNSMTITLNVLAGVLDGVKLDFDDVMNRYGVRDTALTTNRRVHSHSFDIPLSGRIRAGHYTMKVLLYYKNRHVSTDEIQLTALYPSAVLEQKWDDFIGVLTHNYNGGYDFTDFQWYKDGEELFGETGSYVYQPLHYGSEYQCLLTDTSGLQLMTCPLIAAPKEQISLYPTLLTTGEMMQVVTSGPARVSVYNTTGQHVATTEVPAGTSIIAAPRQKGIYIVRINSAEDQRRYQIMVR